MTHSTFVLSLPRGCVGKSSSWLTLYENTHPSLTWHTPDPRVSPMHLISSSTVLDPIYKLKDRYPRLMWTTDSLLIPTDDIVDVYDHYESYDHCEIPLDVRNVSQYTGELRPKLSLEVQNILSELVEYAKVSILVTNNFVLHMYGATKSLEYGKYKLFVILNHLYGYSIQKVELSLSQQPLVAGPDRTNLLTIFQQTGINVYLPPSLSFDNAVNVNEVYLAGDKVNIILAEKLLQDVIVRKTDCLEKECLVSPFVRDVLLLRFQANLENLMVKHATFVQFPSLGSGQSVVRIMGTTRRSIDNSIADLMKLCGLVYCVELKAHLDRQLTAQVTASGVNMMDGPNGTVLYGVNKDIEEALKALKSAGGDGVTMSVLVEQPLELMDFILGKKQGKITKVVNGTDTSITVEKFHEYNFRLRLAGEKASAVLDALKLLEEELPAEKSLYIPEVYHKQIIGQGGLSIQTLMRKYNVYMRFANTTKEKYPNAFGDTRSDNVVIRCPAKNKTQIDSAAQELLSYVDILSKNHRYRYVRLTRNHRRILLATQSNGLREVEVTSGAAIKLPAQEAKDTQLVEISGQTESSTEMAISMMTQMLSQTDYEFRIPWSKRFLAAVDSQSDFSVSVSTPLFLAMSAQVQAFEKVELVGDPLIYSQIVVSVHENFEGELFNDISEVITTYLRKYNLDIVDKGRLCTEIRVEADEDIPTLTSSSSSDTALTDSNKEPRAKQAGTSLYCSPPQHEAQISLEFLRSQSHNSPVATALGPTRDQNGMKRLVTVPKDIPLELPSRPPMSSVQWNRNFDETPVKKRGIENEHDASADSSKLHQRTHPVRLAHFNRRL